jgi:hypothetical protein
LEDYKQNPDMDSDDVMGLIDEYIRLRREYADLAKATYPDDFEE